MHPVSILLKEIDEPVPVVGGFHHDPDQIGFIGLPKVEKESRIIA
jgi:hypothetical protein